MNEASRPEDQRFQQMTQMADGYRGRILRCFSDVEMAISEVLAVAATTPEYSKLKPRFPPMIGQKLERLRRLSTEPGPLLSWAGEILPFLDAVAEHETLRRYMAHGAMTPLVGEGGSAFLVFQFVQWRADRAMREPLMLTPAELRSDALKLEREAGELVRKLAGRPRGASTHIDDTRRCVATAI